MLIFDEKRLVAPTNKSVFDVSVPGGAAAVETQFLWSFFNIQAVRSSLNLINNNSLLVS